MLKDKELSEENARALANLRQQERLHWSTMITTLMGFTAVINVGIWSYFLSEYIKVAGALPSYILIGSAISAITLGLWRIYTRYLDSQIAPLYSELMLYEARMSVPPGLGVSGYLARNVPSLRPILEAELSEDKKSKAIADLAKSKNIGSRGHSLLDVATLCLVVILLIGSLVSLSRVDSFCEPIHVVCLVLVVAGLAFTVTAWRCYQKNPSPKLVEDILQRLSTNIQKDA